MPLIDPRLFTKGSNKGFPSFAECVPQNGNGFGNFDTTMCRIIEKFLPVSKELDVHLIDACFPENYGPGARKILVTNNYIRPEALDPKFYETLAPWFYAVYHGDPDINDIEPTRTLNCLIRRMDPIRQSWLYLLIRRGLLEQSYVSFVMDVTRHHDRHKAEYCETAHEIFERQFNEHCKNFAVEHEYIKTLVPYRNFDPEWSMDQVVLHSRFSLVLETYFDDPGTITVSEKIFRCLKLPRPWILFSTQGTVKYLRSLGLDVLDDVVDHSYDLIEFEIDRQTRLLEIAQDMATWSWTPERLQRYHKAAKHNLDLIAYWYQNYDQEIDAVIAKAMQKHSAL